MREKEKKLSAKALSGKDTVLLETCSWASLKV